MAFKFAEKKKWKQNGIGFAIATVLYMSLAIYTYFFRDFSYISSTVLLFKLIGDVLIVFLLTYRAVYNFLLPQKNYLIFEQDTLSIYRGNIFSRKHIPYDLVQRVTKVNNIIVLQLNDGKEKEIYQEHLTEADRGKLIAKLESIFPEKTANLS